MLNAATIGAADMPGFPTAAMSKLYLRQGWRVLSEEKVLNATAPDQSGYMGAALAGAQLRWRATNPGTRSVTRFTRNFSADTGAGTPSGKQIVWSFKPQLVAQPYRNYDLSGLLAWWADWAAQRPGGLAPLTLAYGQQPPRVPALAQNARVVQVPGLDWPAQVGSRIVALSLPAGQQPPRRRPDDLAGVLGWWSGWGAQSAPLAPPAGPAVVVFFRRDPVAWQPDIWSVPGPGRIAPLTLAYGQQPPGQRPTDLAGILAWWADWAAQAEADNAAWNVAPLAALVPYRRAPAPWTALDWSAQLEATIAPLTLAYGQQPPPFRRDPVPWVPLAWAAQVVGPAALYSLGSDLIGGAPLGLVIGLTVPWPAPVWAPQGSPQVAPLTLVVVLPPPPRRPADVAFVLSWQADWLAQRGPAISPLALPTGQQPPPWSWRDGPALLRAWETSWAAQVAARIAPQTLPTGQQPTPRQRWGAPIVLQGWHVVGWPAQTGASFPPLGLVLFLALSYWHHDRTARVTAEDARSAAAGAGAVGTEGATPESARTVVLTLESYRTVKL